jgi:hypothetical protein
LKQQANGLADVNLLISRSVSTCMTALTFSYA